MERGKATPLHAHDDSDETTYVLEGEIRMHLAGEETRLTTGGLAVAPRGVAPPSSSCPTWRDCCSC
jgi:quercetin dioxygenase-like cupin family protein